MAYIRKVKTASGATAIQIAYKQYGKITKIIHIGSAHNPQEETLLLDIAHQKLHINQQPLFPEIPTTNLSVQLKSSSSNLLRRVLMDQYLSLGFGQLLDDVFAWLILARIVEPTSKLDSLRVLADLGITRLDRNEVYRCLQRIVEQDYRTTICSLCFTRATRKKISLILYDVTTLYFEVQKDDKYRKSGLSKERRLEPQIIIGLLVDQSGFPLSLHSFEGNTAETKTIIPVIEAFCEKHHLDKVTVVADAAMLSLKNLETLSLAGFTYIVGSRISKVPYNLAEYQKHQTLTDNQIVITKQPDRRIIYQYKAQRAALDISNIEQQIMKAKRIISGQAPVKKNKFLTLQTQGKKLNQTLIDKAYALAGIKGYVTNLNIPDEQVIDYYHQLFKIEASFRMAKSNLKARPIFHRKRDSIEAHLTIVLTALAVGKTIELLAHISIKQFIKLLRPIRSGIVTINGQDYPAEENIPPVIHNFLKRLQSGH